jgi:eukaryotic-like serine/threonine-protein kinase
MEETSRRVGDYEILSVLGSGGMGKVYKVRNVISDRIEAMKVLLPDLAGRQDLAERFLREIKLLAGLNHPNIAALCTALTLQNQLVMVMEYVEGTTLATRLERGPIPPAEAMNYIDQILGALSYAHQRGVIHRDIKPANMMLTPEGVVKLMDFGIARSGTDRDLTATGTALGSLSYMPPEQIRGQPADRRSDIYSLGVSLYEMLTGQRPFRGTSDYALMAAQLEQPPRPPIELQPGLPSALNEIILLAMDKDPERRFQTADAFRNALQSIRNLPAPASALSTPASVAGAGGTATALFQGQPTSSASMATTATMVPQPRAPIPQPPATPSVLEMSPKRGGHRGLYMALGAVIVLAILAAAAIYVPRRNRTQASDQAQTREKQKSADTSGEATGSTQTQSGDQSGQQPMGGNGNDSQNQTTGGDGGSKPGGSIDGGVPTPTPPEPVLEPEPKKEPAHVKGPGPGPQPPKPPAEDPHLLEEAEQQVDSATSRAAAVNGSLDTLRRQQAAQGLGLRGDIASTQESMKIHLSRAQAALDNHDAKNAKKYSDQAEAELEKLERFLGR